MHLTEEDVAVFGELDLAGAIDKPVVDALVVSLRRAWERRRVAEK